MRRFHLNLTSISFPPKQGTVLWDVGSTFGVPTCRAPWWWWVSFWRDSLLSLMNDRRWVIYRRCDNIIYAVQRFLCEVWTHEVWKYVFNSVVDCLSNDARDRYFRLKAVRFEQKRHVDFRGFNVTVVETQIHISLHLNQIKGMKITSTLWQTQRASERTVRPPARREGTSPVWRCYFLLFLSKWNDYELQTHLARTRPDSFTRSCSVSERHVPNLIKFGHLDNLKSVNRGEN